MFFETIAKFDTFQFICGTPSNHATTWEYFLTFSSETKIMKIRRSVLPWDVPFTSYTRLGETICARFWDPQSFWWPAEKCNICQNQLIKKFFSYVHVFISCRFSAVANAISKIKQKNYYILLWQNYFSSMAYFQLFGYLLGEIESNFFYYINKL